MSTQEKHDASTPEAKADESKVGSEENRPVDRFAGAIVGGALITLSLVGSAKADGGSGIVMG